MAKFVLITRVRGSKAALIEAENLQEAEEKAIENMLAGSACDTDEERVEMHNSLEQDKGMSGTWFVQELSNETL